ncbi:DUF6122 family protein [Winogradskyella sp.]
MLRFSVHYGLHFGLPLIIAIICFRKHWLKMYLIMLAAFVIDLDHLLANPVFDSNRCSINFHPLHSYFAITVYAFMLIPKTTRVFAVGLVAHILSDGADCLLI